MGLLYISTGITKIMNFLNCIMDYFHLLRNTIWTIYTLKVLNIFFLQIYKYSLPFSAENVCVEVDEKIGLYAVGSRSHVTFIDSRMEAKSISSIHSKDKDSGRDQLG